MIRCEKHQAELSALIDGESNAAAVVKALDHVASCRACQAFWQELRAFQGAVDARPSTVASPPLRRAGRRSGPNSLPSLPSLPSSALPSGGPWGSQSLAPRVAAWAAAAGLVLVVGMAALRGASETPRAANPPETTPITVRLESRPEAMNPARFVALATELLESDRSYRREMSALLAQLDGSTDTTGDLPRTVGARAAAPADIGARERAYQEHGDARGEARSRAGEVASLAN